MEEKRALLGSVLTIWWYQGLVRLMLGLQWIGIDNLVYRGSSRSNGFALLNFFWKQSKNTSQTVLSLFSKSKTAQTQVQECVGAILKGNAHKKWGVVPGQSALGSEI